MPLSPPAPDRQISEKCSSSVPKLELPTRFPRGQLRRCAQAFRSCCSSAAYAPQGQAHVRVRVRAIVDRTRFLVYGFCVWWTSSIIHCVEISLVCTLVCSTYPSTCALFLTHSLCSPSHMYIHLLTYLQTYLLQHTYVQRIGIESSTYVCINRMLLDTHSSRGMFELTSKEAARSPEHLQGKYLTFLIRSLLVYVCMRVRVQL